MACPQRGEKRESSGKSGRKRGAGKMRVSTSRQLVGNSIPDQAAGCQSGRTML
jgi:hypothetical protein